MEILITSERIKKEYERWCRHFGEEDPYDSRETVGLKDVLRAHFLIADYFWDKNFGLGGIGPRDPDLLHSAVYRQFVSFDGRDKWKNQIERCATLVFGLIKDHPFYDANKRTALLVLLYFLTKLNRTPTIGQRELESLVLDIADNRLQRHQRFKELASSVKSIDPEVEYIADYIRRNSRHLDNRYYTITYQELDYRLKEFGFRLHAPRGNYIDIVKIEERRSLMGFGKRKEVYTKVAQIGFPGWKKQVGKGAIATVRRETKLTAEKGIDSATFFRGVDPLYTLIDQYAGPLNRLAFR